MNLQAMTREKLQFLLPVVLTVGPRVPSTGNDDLHADPEEEPEHRIQRHSDALKKFAVLLAENAEARANSANFLEQKIRSIVEGEVRVLVSSMTIEEIFTERELFKKRIHKNLQAELVGHLWFSPSFSFAIIWRSPLLHTHTHTPSQLG